MRWFRFIATTGIVVTAGSVFVHLANLAWSNVSPGPQATDTSIWHVAWFDAGLALLGVGVIGWLVTSAIGGTKNGEGQTFRGPQ